MVARFQGWVQYGTVSYVVRVSNLRMIQYRTLICVIYHTSVALNVIPVPTFHFVSVQTIVASNRILKTYQINVCQLRFLLSGPDGFFMFQFAIKTHN